MKILFLTNSLKEGGANKVCSDLENIFFKNKFETITVSLDGNKCERFEILGKKININIGEKPFPFRMWIGLLYQIFIFGKLIHKEKPDCIISFSANSNLINLISKLFLKTKRIITHHEDTENFIKNNTSVNGKSFRLINKFVFYLLTEKEKFVCVSSSIVEGLIKLYNIKNKIYVINNGINTYNIDFKKDEIIDINFPYIINIGALYKIKNQELLLTAYAKIHNQIKEHILFLGEGEDLDKLKNISNKLGISEKVHFVGFTDNPYKYIKKSSIFVSCSLSESFGLSLIESMYLKIPSIALRNNGINEIVGNTDSIVIIDESDKDILAGKILYLLKNKNQLINNIESGFNRTKEFSIENQYNKFIELINT